MGLPSEPCFRPGRQAPTLITGAAARRPENPLAAQRGRFHRARDYDRQGMTSFIEAPTHRSYGG